jgi:phosphate-selective porin OprO/OprP
MAKCVSVVAVAGMLCAVLFGASTAKAGVEELKFGGRFMWDQVVWGDVDDDLGLDHENGTEVRRARIFFQGRIYPRLSFKVNWDFADGEEVALKDAYLEFVGIPAVGSIRVGHMLQPLCMNELTSSKYITFLERASLTTFAPSHNSGLLLAGEVGGRVLWQAGAFRQTDDFGAASGDRGVSAGGRVSALAMGEDKGDRLVHVGASVDHLMPEGNAVEFSARPEIHMSGKPVDTGELTADGVTRFGAEAAAVFGPLHLAGEYIVANVSCTSDTTSGRSAGGKDASLSGFYAQAGWFLTGEHRSFAKGQWQRTSPRTNFLEDGGSGAWEVAARYSSIDLNDTDAGIEGGRMDDITVGLNWYLHANARVMLDEIWSTVKDADGNDVGSGSATTMRFQFDF